jgi:FkbM family methyltransferase
MTSVLAGSRRGRIRARRQLNRLRRRAFERAGSPRYSRPGNDDLDRKLAPYLPEDPGFFVEAGAFDGFIASNTYYLERFRGWSGVLVEPIPVLYRQCVRQRPRSLTYNCALVSRDFPDDELTMLYGGCTSVVKDAWDYVLTDGEARQSQRDWSARGCRYEGEEAYEVTVPARTLTSVLDEARAPQIDFLSLDVEGHEAQVLGGLDFERYAPRLILLEAFESFGSTRSEIESALPGYHALARLTQADVLFARDAP